VSATGAALPRNRFKAALAGPHVQYGMFVGLADPIAAEIAAGAGFDWIMIDTEHGPNDLRTLLVQLQAAAASPCSVLVRPYEGDTALIKRILDLGAQTLVVPMCESVEQAEELVAAIRYPPAGVRGVGTSLSRAAQWNRIDDYVHLAERELCLVLQIESAAALDHVERIAAVDGVDALFVGPSDLAASMGHIGDAAHPEVRAAVTGALEVIHRTGTPVGVFATSVDAAQTYVAAGASFVAVGSDTAMLASATSALADLHRGSGAGGSSS